MAHTIVVGSAFGFLAFAAAAGLSLILDPKWLRDQPHPDEETSE